MLATFQDWANLVVFSHKSSSTYYLQTDGGYKLKNKPIILIFGVRKLEDSINWVQAALSIQIEVNTAVCGPREKSPWHILLGFDPKLGSTPLPIPRPILSNLA